jgi:hypothetical protein
MEGLVGYWNFDETSGPRARDSSRYEHHGELFDRPSRVQGKFGMALNFDGVNDYVTIPDSADLRLSTQQTISVWYKWTGGGSNWRRLVGKGDYWNRNYGLWIRPESHEILFQIWGPGQRGCEVKNPNVDFDTDWHHLAGTYYEGAFRLYFDGQLVQENYCPITPSNTDHPVTVGFASGPWNDTDNSPFNGLIDDVRIYKRVLNSCEVASLAGRPCQ